MAVNKVVYDGNTLVDLTNDTVTAAALAEGVTAHDAAGNEVTGTMPTSAVLYTEQTLTDTQKEQARENIGVASEDRLNDFYDSKTSRTANTVLAAPNGSAGSASFRNLVAADIPSLPASKITSGTLAIARGGTGVTSHTDTTYTTARYRASALVAAETTPTVNGVINWLYE